MRPVHDSWAVRTCLLVVLYKTFFFNYFFSLNLALQASQNVAIKSLDKISKLFASRLYGSSHLPVSDMKIICKRARVLNASLKMKPNLLTSHAHLATLLEGRHKVKKYCLENIFNHPTINSKSNFHSYQRKKVFFLFYT